MGSDNIDAGTVNGSGPLGSPDTETALFDEIDRAPAVGFVPLQFDAAEFMQFVEDEDLTEEEAALLLRMIWDIMVQFVDFAFGVHPIQQVVDGFPLRASGSLPDESGDVLSSRTLTDTTKTKTARRTRRSAAKEDS